MACPRSARTSLASPSRSVVASLSLSPLSLARRASAVAVALAALTACGGSHSSRGAPPPIPPILPALGPEAARPITSPSLRCSTFEGRATAALDRAVAERAHVVESCYRASVAAGMPVRGVLALDLAVAEDGEVLGATVRDTDQALDRVGACVSDAFRAAPLPAPESGCVRLAWAVALGVTPAPVRAKPVDPAANTW